MRVALLGPLEVSVDGRKVAIGPARRRGVVALLAMRPGREVPASRLVEALWGEDPSGSAGRALLSCVENLRRRLPPGAISSTPSGYLLDVAPDDIDSVCFESRLADGRRLAGDRRMSDAARVLVEALALWRGRPLVELGEYPIGRAEADRLEELYRSAIEDLADTRLAAGVDGTLVAELEASVAAEPLRERRWEQLMLALYRSGRQIDALRAYGRVCTLLAEELGLAPGSALQDLEHAILNHGPELNRLEAAPARRRPAVEAEGNGTLPAGTVTFLFTDIEGSTRRWEDEPAAMSAALAEHDQALRTAIDAHGGRVFKHTGDGLCAAFVSPRGAIDAAIEAQRQLNLPVRMGINTGEAEQRGGDYFGPVLNRTARITAAGHGGQVLVAASTASMLAGVELCDLGEHRLRDVPERQRIFQVRAAGLAPGFPPLRTEHMVAGNLPVRLSSFLGRDAEVAAVIEALRLRRLVTLAGPGGVGKTRLAITVADAARSGFPDGAWFVELAPVSNPADIASAVATTLGVTQQPGLTTIQSVAQALAGRQLLLVVDNCEHLLAATSEVIEAVLTAGAGVRVLATSRERLGLDGEQNWPVPPLGLGGPTSAAVCLFAERARAMQPAFDPTSDSEAIEKVCRHLDGLPLAIELAAVRVTSMTPAEMATRLDNRLSLLGGNDRIAARHRTLARVTQWSYDLLTDGERALLCRLSVFAGGFTLDAAQAVSCGERAADDTAMADGVDSLVRKSLVMAQQSAGRTRFGLLETIRQFALERLDEAGETAAVRGLHAAHFASVAEAILDVWFTPNQRAAYEWLDDEFPNLRAALSWSRDNNDMATSVRIVAGVGFVRKWRGHADTLNWASEVLDAARRAQAPQLPWLLVTAADAAFQVGRVADMRALADEALALEGNPRVRPTAMAYMYAAVAAAYQGDADRALEVVGRGAQHDDDRRHRFAGTCRVFINGLCGHRDEAVDLADETVAAARQTGLPLSIAMAEWTRAQAFQVSDPATALQAYQRSVDIAQNSLNLAWAGLAARTQGFLQAIAGDTDEALDTLGAVLEAQPFGVMVIIDAAIVSLVLLFDRLDRYETAATLYGHIDPGVRPIAVDAFEADHLTRTVGRLKQRLGDAIFERCRAEGMALDSYQARGYALEQIRAARAASSLETPTASDKPPGFRRAVSR